jgi:hypothetical protein
VEPARRAADGASSLALPLPTRTPGLEKEGGSQPASQPYSSGSYTVVQPYSSHTVVEPYSSHTIVLWSSATLGLWPSFLRSLRALPSQSSVMWLARLPPLSSEHPPSLGQPCPQWA